MKTKDNISYDLKEMFRCLNDKESAIDMKAKSKFIKAIDKYVQQHNANNTWRYGSMMFDLRMQDNYRDGRAEGLVEGKAEGLAKGKAEGPSPKQS